MFIRSYFTFEGRLAPLAEALLNSALLLLLVFPVLYIALVRPMRLKIAALREAREEVRRKNRELEYMAEQTEQILTAAEEGILGLDIEGKTVFTNPAAEKILGWSREELIGKNHHGLVGHFCCSGKARSGGCPARQCLFGGDVVHQMEAQFMRKDGFIFPAEISCAPMREGSRIIGAVLTFRDITERKKNEERLREMAYFDTLTGLPNRSLLQDRFDHLVAQAKREDKIPTIMFIDLDDFKTINDRHGHAAGDAYLKEIAMRARDSIRETDTVARLGGDEFVWAGLVNDQAEASLVARKILDSLSSPILTGGKVLQVSASIGIAFHRQHGRNFEELLKAADYAMYRAKEEGKSGFFFSGPSSEGRDLNRKKRPRIRRHTGVNS